MELVSRLRGNDMELVSRLRGNDMELVSRLRGNDVELMGPPMDLADKFRCSNRFPVSLNVDFSLWVEHAVRLLYHPRLADKTIFRVAEAFCNA